MTGGSIPADETEPESLADVVDHLAAIFVPRLSRPTIVRVVRRCRRELDILHTAALPEMVERLAHQRLASAITDQIP